MQASSSSRPVTFTQQLTLPGRLVSAQPLCQRHGLHAAAAAARTSSQHVDGLSEIALKYEAVLLDQFGVLHDGKQTYSPATVTAVQRLAAAGLKVFIVSNSSRRSSGTIKKLQKLGFDAGWFSGAVTSGDMTHLHLEQRPTAWWQALGHRCIHFTWSSRGNISLDGLALQVTTDPLEADFILAHGTEALGQPDGAPAVDASLDGMRALMRRCAERRLPMVVANPDLVTVDGADNGLALMPGSLARWYSDMGGCVHLMGKPAPVIYAAAMRELGVHASRILAIGDSLEHDVAGAAAAGIDTLFIAGGIHAGELQAIPSGGTLPASYSAQALQLLSKTHGVVPTFSMAYLQW